jgi:hypothetical protein
LRCRLDRRKNEVIRRNKANQQPPRTLRGIPAIGRKGNARMGRKPKLAA